MNRSVNGYMAAKEKQILSSSASTLPALREPVRNPEEKNCFTVEAQSRSTFPLAIGGDRLLVLLKTCSSTKPGKSPDESSSGLYLRDHID